MPIDDKVASPGPAPVSAVSGRRSRVFWWLTLALVLAATTAVRIRLMQMPLERDEGEYAYGGQLLLQGVMPYEGFYTMKWPGTHAAYALIMAVFGQTPGGIRAGLIGVVLATAGLIYAMGKRIGGHPTGAAAAGTYALLSIHPITVGLAAHATHFVVLFALAGLWLIQELDERTTWRRLFTAGLLLGLAALMKQAGAAFGLFAVFWIVWRELTVLPLDRRRLLFRLCILAAGGLLPLVIVCVLVARAGVFQSFLFWTIDYAQAYGRLRKFADGLSDLWGTMGLLFKTAPGIWIAAGLGLGLMWFRGWGRSHRAFLLGLSLCSFLAICPGWYFRGHYFLLLMPCVGLLAGLAVKTFEELLALFRVTGQAAKLVSLLIFAGIAAHQMFHWRWIYFQLPPAKIWCSAYTPNFFGNALEVGNYLKNHCPETARIAVLGSEPEIYFHSHRRSATGHIYMYPLMEDHPYAETMQRQLIQEIESARPQYLVWVQDKHSWVQRETSPRLVNEWFVAYGAEHLELVALLQLLPPDKTAYNWSVRDQPLALQSELWLGIFKDRRY